MARVITTIGLAMLVGAGAFADDSLPAVSGPNGKVDYLGGWVNSDESHNVSGSISVPITSHFGLQGDGMYTHVFGRDSYSGAGHFFWRNPEIGLIGVTGGGLFTDGVLNSYQAAAEAEYYFNHFTVGAIAGMGHIAYDLSFPFIDSDPTRFVGALSADWYATDNLRLGVMYLYAFDNHLGQIEAEYQTPWKGLTFTAEYARGENDYDHALFGVRFYFGGDKTLKARHREDDPRGATHTMFTAVGLYGAEFEHKEENYRKLHRVPTRTIRLNPQGYPTNGVPYPPSLEPIGNEPPPVGTIEEPPFNPSSSDSGVVTVNVTGDVSAVVTLPQIDRGVYSEYSHAVFTLPHPVVLDPGTIISGHPITELPPTPEGLQESQRNVYRYRFR